MENKRVREFDKIVELNEKGQDALNSYWMDYSLYTSFEYWLMAAFFFVPLIVLYFKIDRSKIFLLGFYGYSIHVFFNYTDWYGKNSGFWNYPFPLIPVTPGISIDSSLIPVVFMLVYQWTLNKVKNYYVYTILTAGFLAFVFKPFLIAVGLFRMYGNTHYLHLFAGYLIVLLIAKIVTNFFLWMEKRYKQSAGMNKMKNPRT